MKISNNEIISNILFFFLFQQIWSPILIFGIINEIFVLISKLIAFVLILELLAKAPNNLSILKLTSLVGIIYLSLLVSTIHGGGDIRRWFSMTYCPLGLTALFTMNFSSIKKAQSFIKAISSLMMCVCFCEFLFVLIYPLGMNVGQGTNMYFLGGENYVGFPLLVGLFIIICDHIINGVSIKRLYAYIFMQSTTVLIIFSGGNLTGTFVAVMLLLPYMRIITKFSTIRLIVSLMLIFIFLIIFNNLQNIITNPIVRYIVEDQLGKDLTLTHRTVIWDQVIYKFFMKPIWGYGMQDTYNLFTIPVGNTFKTFSAHNQLLQSLYEGGILLFLAFTPLFMVVNKLIKSSLTKHYFNAIIIGLLVMYMSEASGIIFLIIIMSLGYCIGTYHKIHMAEYLKSHHAKRYIQDKYNYIIEKF